MALTHCTYTANGAGRYVSGTHMPCVPGDIVADWHQCPGCRIYIHSAWSGKPCTPGMQRILDRTIHERVMGKDDQTVPHYSGGLGEAWRLVEHFVGRGYIARVEWASTHHTWRAVLQPPGAYALVYAALTPQDAICHVALLAAGVTDAPEVAA